MNDGAVIAIYATCALLELFCTRRPPSANKDNNAQVAYSVFCNETYKGCVVRVTPNASQWNFLARDKRTKREGFIYVTAPVCAYYNVTFKTPFPFM